MKFLNKSELNKLDNNGKILYTNNLFQSVSGCYLISKALDISLDSDRLTIIEKENIQLIKEYLFPLYDESSELMKGEEKEFFSGG